MTATVSAGNLFAGISRESAAEEITELLAAPGITVERIVSTGQSSPPGHWYDLDRAEWVLVLSGSAALLIEGEAASRRLGPGDYLHLPAHVRHRVEATDRDQPTVWLALHLG